MGMRRSGRPIQTSTKPVYVNEPPTELQHHREYKSKDAAGQLDKSPFEFSSLGASSPLVWLAKGYAVLSGPSMPIVAEGDEEPNDTYVRQLVGAPRSACCVVVCIRCRSGFESVSAPWRRKHAWRTLHICAAPPPRQPGSA